MRMYFCLNSSLGFFLIPFQGCFPHHILVTQTMLWHSVTTTNKATRFWQFTRPQSLGGFGMATWHVPTIASTLNRSAVSNGQRDLAPLAKSPMPHHESWTTKDCDLVVCKTHWNAPVLNTRVLNANGRWWKLLAVVYPQTGTSALPKTPNTFIQWC